MFLWGHSIAFPIKWCHCRLNPQLFSNMLIKSLFSPSFIFTQFISEGKNKLVDKQKTLEINAVVYSIIYSVRIIFSVYWSEVNLPTGNIHINQNNTVEENYFYRLFSCFGFYARGKMLDVDIITKDWSYYNCLLINLSFSVNN